MDAPGTIPISISRMAISSLPSTSTTVALSPTRTSDKRFSIKVLPVQARCNRRHFEDKVAIHLTGQCTWPLLESLPRVDRSKAPIRLNAGRAQGFRRRVKSSPNCRPQRIAGELRRPYPPWRGSYPMGGASSEAALMIMSLNIISAPRQEGNQSKNQDARNHQRLEWTAHGRANLRPPRQRQLIRFPCHSRTFLNTWRSLRPNSPAWQCRTRGIMLRNGQLFAATPYQRPFVPPT
jgi:hypothetical protein